MKQLFSIDGPVMGFMGQLTDMIFLSLLWLMCCIPVVTIGTSTSAMYYVALKMARGELSGVAKAFFHAFKDNFGAGILYTLIFGAAGAMLCFDYLIMVQFTGVLGAVAREAVVMAGRRRAFSQENFIVSFLRLSLFSNKKGEVI